jgi:hypothetical protein
MRRLVIGVLVAGFAAGACNRSPDAVGGTPAGTAQPDAAAVATTGAGDRARELTPLEAAVSKTVVREVTIPAGTELPVVLDTSVGSDSSEVEAPVRAHLSRAVLVNGEPVLAEGSTVSGVVTDATRSAKVKGRASVGVRFDSLTPAGADERYRIQTAAINRTAAATTKEDAIKIGAPAAGGAIIGGIIVGKKGAAIGTAVGGGGGAAVVLATAGEEIRLARGAVLTLPTEQTIDVRVPIKKS